MVFPSEPSSRQQRCNRNKASDTLQFRHNYISGCFLTWSCPSEIPVAVYTLAAIEAFRRTSDRINGIVLGATRNHSGSREDWIAKLEPKAFQESYTIVELMFQESSPREFPKRVFQYIEFPKVVSQERFPRKFPKTVFQDSISREFPKICFLLMFRESFQE